MAAQQVPVEISPGLYETDSLGMFNKRQAWTGELAAGSEYQFMTVGDQEVLRFSRVKEHSPLTHRESELSLIRQVVQTGTAKIHELQSVQRAAASLQTAVDNLSPSSESLEVGFDFFRALISIERASRARQKIEDAAGYIAARESLWIVTKSEPIESGTANLNKAPLQIGVARLVGLAIDPEDHKHAVAQPVVNGKNGKIGKLLNVQRDPRPQLHPKQLDVLEGIRTRP